jgi:tetratricopeptide (TPR) repeat protein
LVRLLKSSSRLLFMTNASDPSVPPGNESTASNGPSSDVEDASQATEGGDASIPIPPRAPIITWPQTPEQFAIELRRLDSVLVVIGMVLAFMVASFAIRNTDYWMHLATGRLLARGEFSFGHDPFAYTTGNTYWVNHSWLFDLGLYGLTHLAGGPESWAAGVVLVVAKALATVAVFCLLIGIRRPDQGLWVPLLCATLAVLAMSQRLLVQPVLLSVVFLALTVFILVKPRNIEGRMSRGSAGAAGPGGSSLKIYWLLPPLFVLWVNLDSWFLLGPLTVLLYWLGQLVQAYLAPVRTGADAPEPNQLGILFLVLLVGSAACFINPHHYHAFTLPAQLSWAGSRELLKGDPWLRQGFLNPLEEYWARGTGRLSVVGIAYFLLWGLSFLSLVSSLFSGWRWWRLFLWLPFAILSAYQIRNVAFFAVVAAPIMALNIQDFVRSRLDATASEWSWNKWSLAGRVAAILVGLVLVAAAWPGWLHGRPSDLRQNQRVSWAVITDPSMKKAAEQLKAWRSSGLLPPNQNGFNDVPELVNYCAWFCADERGLPYEKGFLDYRFQLFSNSVIKNYLDLRRALRPRSQGAEPAPVNVQGMFREYGIDHIVVNAVARGSEDIGRHLLQDWAEWRVVYLDGRTTIFCWEDPQAESAALKRGERPREGSEGPPRLDLHALAFGPDPEKAPEQSLVEPQAQTFWTRFLDGPPSRPLDADKSVGYQNYFETISAMSFRRTLASSAVAAWDAPIPSNAAALLRTLVGVQPGPYFDRFSIDRNLCSAAPSILAVRAARRAVAASPDNASVYATLAQSYLLLWGRQEHQWQPTLRPEQGPLTRLKLRQVQVATALEQSLKLNSEDPDVHYSLAGLYQQLRYYDLAADHLDETLKLLSKRRSGTEQSGRSIEALEKTFREIDSNVMRQRNEFEYIAAGQQPALDPLSKARLALNKGLAKQALDVLGDPGLGSSLEALTMNLDLLLSTGKADDVRRALSSEQLLGGQFTNYRILLDAATGNYEEAIRSLDELVAGTEKAEEGGLLMMVRAGTFQGVLTPMSLGVLSNNVPEMERRLGDLRVIAGLLSLERGDNGSAARHFRQALEGVDSDNLEFNGRIFAKRYLELIDPAGGAKLKH